MARYRLDLEYDGHDFLGWQVQPEGRTVQGAVEAALARLVARTVRVTGAGRTDRGVHATGQVAHFDSPLELRTRDMRRALGGLLPADVRVKRVARVSDGFHARFDAAARHYVYLIARRRTAFNAGHVWGLDEARLDLEAMRAATRAVIGEHDFRPFAMTAAADSTGLCQVRRAVWTHWRGGWRLSIEADRFLMRMVRLLVGTMVEVGRGRIAPGVVGEALAAGEPPAPRPAAAPAGGLYLAGVRYPSAVYDISS